MAELSSMPNIGKEIEKKLISVGIGSAEELTKLGSKEAFLRLKTRYPMFVRFTCIRSKGLSTEQSTTVFPMKSSVI
ncbi:MAG: TfoX/Sxy family DNA transformation protein [Ruminococcus sp.]|nr:TfoX/Sxy family DNA transformation protein [Ruminococcus sp.]